MRRRNIVRTDGDAAGLHAELLHRLVDRRRVAGGDGSDEVATLFIDLRRPFLDRFGQLGELAVRESFEGKGRALLRIVLLDALLGASLTLVDGDRAGIAVAEHDHAGLLAGQLFSEGGRLVAIDDAGDILVLPDNAEPELFRIILPTLVDDDHGYALGDAALEGGDQAGTLELGKDDVGLGGNRVVDLLDVI